MREHGESGAGGVGGVEVGVVEGVGGVAGGVLLVHVVDELALVEVEDAGGAFGGPGVVGDHDDGLAELAVELFAGGRGYPRRDWRSRSPVGSSATRR